MNCFSANIRPSKKYKPPTHYNLLHNVGLKNASYWLQKDPNVYYEIYDLEKSSVSNEKIDMQIENIDDVKKLWQKWVERAEQLYFKAHNRKLRSDAIKVEEGLIIVGRDVEDRKNLQKLQKTFNAFKFLFENETNTRILGSFYHIDHEGYINNDNEVINNVHIHYFFSNVSNNGNMVRRNLSREFFSNLQEMVYVSAMNYFSKIQRATNYKQNKKAPKHIHHLFYKYKMLHPEPPKKKNNDEKEEYKSDVEILNEIILEQQKKREEEFEKEYQNAMQFLEKRNKKDALQQNDSNIIKM